MNHELVIGIEERFERRLRKYRQSRFRKLVTSPIAFIESAAMQAVAARRRYGIRVKAETFWGEDMTVVYPDVVSVALRRYGFFEQALTRLMLGTLKPGMTFIDVGAQFGYFTLLARHILGKEGQVHSFEPTPSTFEVLQSNTTGKRSVKVNQTALWFQ